MAKTKLPYYPMAVSPACDHCYAEAWAKRTGFQVWGKDAPRRTDWANGAPVKYQCAQCPAEITWGRLCYACKMRNMRHTRARRAYLLMQRHTEPRPKRLTDPVKVARDVQQAIPIGESIAQLDAQFPWLRGAERGH